MKGAALFLPISPEYILCLYDRKTYGINEKGRIAKADENDVKLLNTCQFLNTESCIFTRKLGIDYKAFSEFSSSYRKAVKTTIKNNTKGLIDLDTDAFWLNIDGKFYYPVLDRSGKFLDMGKPYYGEKIGAGVQEEIVLVYEFENTSL